MPVEHQAGAEEAVAGGRDFQRGADGRRRCIDGIGVPMVTAMTLNLNGNSIAVSESLYRELQLREREPLSAGRALKGLLLVRGCAAAQARVTPSTFSGALFQIWKVLTTR